MVKRAGGLLFLAALLLLPAGAAAQPPEGRGPGRGMKIGKAAGIMGQPVTGVEEYHLGRAVAARVLAQHPLCLDEQLTLYVNQVGAALVRHSSRPRVFKGYHFAVLDTQEPFTLACPGGFILVSRGAIKICATEDELAALLAHELAHVAHRDGIKAIKQARWAEIMAAARTKAAQQQGGDLGELATLYADSVEDICKTLMVQGYNRQREWHADHEALRTLTLAGYNPGALAGLLAKMAALEEKGRVIFKSHPPAAWRLAKVREQVGESRPDPVESRRTARFKKQNF